MKAGAWFTAAAGTTTSGWPAAAPQPAEASRGGWRRSTGGSTARAGGSSAGRASPGLTAAIFAHGSGTTAPRRGRPSPWWTATAAAACRPPGRPASRVPAAEAGVAKCVGTCVPGTSPAASAPTTATAEATVAMPGERNAAEHRRLSEPRQRSHRQPQPTKRDPQERPDDARVELRAGAACDLVARCRGILRLLVRARGGDDVEHVGDGDDAARERDVFALGAFRIALAVPALVMIGDRVRPLTQPPAQRRGQPGSDFGVAAYQRPLLLARAPRLVEDLRRHLELADVVQQRRPVQPVDLVTVKAKLLRDHLRIRAHPLGMPARHVIVRTQRRHEPEQPLGGLHRRVRVRAPPGLLEALRGPVARVQRRSGSATAPHPETRARA